MRKWAGTHIRVFALAVMALAVLGPVPGVAAPRDEGNRNGAGRPADPGKSNESTGHQADGPSQGLHRGWDHNAPQEIPPQGTTSPAAAPVSGVPCLPPQIYDPRRGDPPAFLDVLRALGDIASSPSAAREYRCVSTRDVAFADGKAEHWVNRTLVKGGTRRYDVYGPFRSVTMIEDGRVKIWEQGQGWEELQRQWDTTARPIQDFPPMGSLDEPAEPSVTWGSRPEDLYVAFGRTSEGRLVWDVDWAAKLVRGRSFWSPDGRLVWEEAVTEERRDGGRFPVTVVHRSHIGDTDHVEKWEWKIGPGSVWMSELYEEPGNR